MPVVSGCRLHLLFDELEKQCSPLIREAANIMRKVFLPRWPNLCLRVHRNLAEQHPAEGFAVCAPSTGSPPEEAGLLLRKNAHSHRKRKNLCQPGAEKRHDKRAKMVPASRKVEKVAVFEDLPGQVRRCLEVIWKQDSEHVTAREPGAAAAQAQTMFGTMLFRRHQSYPPFDGCICDQEGRLAIIPAAIQILQCTFRQAVLVRKRYLLDIPPAERASLPRVVLQHQFLADDRRQRANSFLVVEPQALRQLLGAAMGRMRIPFARKKRILQSLRFADWEERLGRMTEYSGIALEELAVAQKRIHALQQAVLVARLQKERAHQLYLATVEKLQTANRELAQLRKHRAGHAGGGTTQENWFASKSKGVLARLANLPAHHYHLRKEFAALTRRAMEHQIRRPSGSEADAAWLEEKRALAKSRAALFARLFVIGKACVAPSAT